MKNYLKSTVAFGIALSMLAAPVAMAQQDQHDNGTPPAGQTQKPPEAAQHTAPAQLPHPQVQQHAQTPQHPITQQHTVTQDHAMGPPSMQSLHPQHPVVHQVQVSHQWHNGNHYTGSRRVIYQGDWARYHLRQPPYGYEWVQDGDEFILIAITSGIIADVILNAMNQ
ncbi:MAG: RcnB family protein [Acidocella sp.]|nr:RcnB family protein [Acidocella sp.]